MIAAALAALFTTSVYAQPGGDRMGAEDREERRAEMVQKQADRLAKEFNLTGDAKSKFLADYTAYREALISARNQKKAVGEETLSEKKRKELTDAEATQLLEEQFTREAEQVAQSQLRLEVKRNYYNLWKQQLTPQQLLKVFAERQRTQQQRTNDPRGGFGPQGGFGSGFGGGGF